MEKIIIERYKITKEEMRPSDFCYLFGILMTAVLLILYYVSNKKVLFILSSVIMFILSVLILTPGGKKAFDYNKEEIK